MQHLGLQRFARQFLGDIPQPPVFTVPGTRHYSFPKAAAVLGIGAENMLEVAVNTDARQDLSHLRQMLDDCLSHKRPIYTVVAVIGSTEESAVDPLRAIIEFREDYRKKGLDFTVHADGAFGGYHASLIRDDFLLATPAAIVKAPPLLLPASSYDDDPALGACTSPDSITVDPHKSG